MATKPSQTNPIQPYGIEVKNAPAYWSQDILWTVLASSEQTGGSYSLMEELCSKHSGPPPHTHEQDEALYILEGEITLAVGAEKTVAKAGSLAYIPARCVHSFRVDTQETQLLNFYLPGGFQHVITEIGVPAAARTLPPAGVKTRGTPGAFVQRSANRHGGGGETGPKLADATKLRGMDAGYVVSRRPRRRRAPSES